MVCLAGGVSPFVRAAGGVQIRSGDFRKDRRPNGETYRTPETPSGMDDHTTTTSGITSPRQQPSTPSVISAYPPPYAN